MGWGADTLVVCPIAGLLDVCLITSLPVDTGIGDGNMIVTTPGKEEVLVERGGGGADLDTAVDIGIPPEGIGGTCTVLEVHRTCWRMLLGQLNTTSRSRSPQQGYKSQKYDRMGKQKHTNLSCVDIASLVKLRVVHTQNGHIQPIRGSNFFTCVTGFDNLSG